MKVIVKLLRSRGSPRPDQQIRSDEGRAGVLTGAIVGSRYVLKLHAIGDDSQMRPILPELVDATNISLHSGKMLFRGVAQDAVGQPEASARYEQEWSIKVVNSID